jgi:hypothetical protein
MDEDKKQEATGAQQQIERLMRLKAEKDKKDKLRMDNAGSDETSMPAKKKVEALRQDSGEKIRAVPALKKKPANTVKVEKRVYEKLHKLVNALNITGGARITKARFVNIILKEFLALDIDYSFIKSDEEIKKIFGRIKTGN